MLESWRYLLFQNKLENKHGHAVSRNYLTFALCLGKAQRINMACKAPWSDCLAHCPASCQIPYRLTANYVLSRDMISVNFVSMFWDEGSHHSSPTLQMRNLKPTSLPKIRKPESGWWSNNCSAHTLDPLFPLPLRSGRKITFLIFLSFYYLGCVLGIDTQAKVQQGFLGSFEMFWAQQSTFPLPPPWVLLPGAMPFLDEERTEP